MQQVIDFGTSEPTLAPILTGDKWDTVWQTLANDEDLNYVDASTGTSMANLITTGTNAIYKALTDGWTMSLAYSSGKDSECVLHLFLMARQDRHTGRLKRPRRDAGGDIARIMDHIRQRLHLPQGILGLQRQRLPRCLTHDQMRLDGRHIA